MSPPARQASKELNPLAFWWARSRGGIVVRKPLLFRLVFAILVVLVAPESAASHQGDPAASDPARVAFQFIHNLDTADVDAILALFDDDATPFAPFSSLPERVKGKEEIARVFAPIFSELRASGDGPEYMHLVPRGIEDQSSVDCAVATFHLGVIPAEPFSFSRRSLVLCRSEAGWRIIHLHASNMLIAGAPPDLQQWGV